VLIDGGLGETEVRDTLLALGVTAIDLVIATHAHADHIGGLAAVVERFEPRFFMDNALPATTQVYERLLQALAAAPTQVLEPGERRLTLGEVVITLLPHPAEPAWGQNNNSIGVIIQYGDFRASSFGDAEERLQSWWLRQATAHLAPVAVHKSSHHGSRAGDTAAMLARLAPELVIISVGAGNRYGHPHPEVLALLDAIGAQVLRTDRQGAVTIFAERDGSYRIAFSGLPPERSASPAPGAASTDSAGCVDLNRASPEQLQTIRHIGPERAREIIDHRPWRSPQELTRIAGIGPARLADILAEGLACVPGGSP
jgi:competence protein ComEC